MADKDKAAKEVSVKTVKVETDYPFISDFLNLWGVGFTWTDGDNACYVAEISSEDAKLMVDAGRVKLVK